MQRLELATVWALTGVSVDVDGDTIEDFRLESYVSVDLAQELCSLCSHVVGLKLTVNP